MSNVNLTLSQWAKLQIGKEMRVGISHGETTKWRERALSKAVSYRLGTNYRGAWFTLDNGDEVYRKYGRKARGDG